MLDRGVPAVHRGTQARFALSGFYLGLVIVVLLILPLPTIGAASALPAPIPSNHDAAVADESSSQDATPKEIRVGSSRLELGPRVTLKGEAWTGEGLGDVRGGIGQTVNTETGQEIEADGGWIELGIEASPHYSVFLGYTTDDPNDADVQVGGRSENSAAYIVNRFTWGQPFTIGVDYLDWETEYRNLPKGDDNRINLYLIYRF